MVETDGVKSENFQLRVVLARSHHNTIKAQQR